MTHRAELIVDAVVDAVKLWSPSHIKAYAHRRLSLSDEADELPAISVDFGEDQPVDGPADLLAGQIQSLLTINVTGVAVGHDEPTLRKALLNLRKEAHIAIRKTQNLGLPFVIDTHYGGANPPDVDASGDLFVGELTSQWGVRYEMEAKTPE